MAPPQTSAVAAPPDLSGPSLAIVKGPERGTIFPLVFSETLIGRIDANQIVVEDPTVSRVHARIVISESGITVADLGTSGGTFVNGQRIKAPTALHDGDQLTVGEAAFVFTNTPSEDLGSG